MTTQQHRFSDRKYGYKSAPFSRFIEDILNTNLGDVIENAFVANRAFLNVYESDASFDLHIAAPGLVKSDFKLEVKDGLLHVSADKTSTEPTPGVEVRSREFDFGKFHRTFRLDERVNTDQITAKYEAGVLIITVPKRTKDTWKKEIRVD